MAKPDRLFRLLHLLRGLPPPVTAARLAQALEVSLRTLYRDIEALRAAGARIEGEAGFGYQLTEDLALPPQTLSQLEIEALVIGLGLTEQRADPALAQAARDAQIKIIASLPDSKQRLAQHAASLVARDRPPHPPAANEHAQAAAIRQAIWEERAIEIRYTDRAGRETTRTLWPLSLAYLARATMLLAWCGLRQDFRMFHLGQISAVLPLPERFRPRRVALLETYIAQLRARPAPAPDCPHA